MLYLLDTNVISDLSRDIPQVRHHIQALAVTDRVVTCAVVEGEVIFGIARLPTGKRRSELEQRIAGVLAAFDCVPVPADAGPIYASIKLHRQRLGTTLDENDLWIAATALSVGAVLVSRDRDFSDVPGLKIENWTLPVTP